MAMSKVGPGGAEDSTVPPPAEAQMQKRAFRSLKGYNERVTQSKRKNEQSNECSRTPP
jgi:hypothetical protein